MKKTISLLLSLVIIFTSVFSINFNAYAEIKTGTCGNNLTWSFDSSTKTLKINGTGNMDNYSYFNTPWHSLDDSIEKIVIEENVTSIGAYAFYYLLNLISISIPLSVTKIGDYALDSFNLKSIFYDGTKKQWDEIENLYPWDYDDFIVYCSDGAYNCDHKWGNPIICVTATSKENGKYYTECSNCKEKKYTTILKIGYVDLSEYEYTYNGKNKIPSVEVYNSNNKKLTQDKDYKITYDTDTKSVGKHCVRINFIGNYSGEIKEYYTINPIKVSFSASLSSTIYTYDGKVKTPTVNIKFNNGKTYQKDVDYSIIYSNGRKNVGQYTATVKFKGIYSGSKTLTFKIIPKKVDINCVVPKDKAVTVYWKNNTSQTTGYQIQYSTSSSFKSSKSVYVNSYKTTSKTISNLSNSKKYYIRIRAYKTVSIDGKTQKLYSNWSKTVTRDAKNISLIRNQKYTLSHVEKATFSSSNKKIATVDKNGKITAKQLGSCYITVKTSGKTYKIKITVKYATPHFYAQLYDYYTRDNYFEVKITNKGSKKLTIHSSGACVEDKDYKSYDRDLKLSGNKSVTIDPGKTKYLKFYVKGSNTWSDYEDFTLYFYFTYDGKKYLAYTESEDCGYKNGKNWYYSFPDNEEEKYFSWLY